MNTDRDAILKAFPLAQHLRDIGVKLHGGSVRHKTANRCPQQQHGKDHFCVSIDLERQIFHCNDCDCGGSLIDWLAIEQKKPPGTVLKELGAKLGNGSLGANGQATEPTSKPQFVGIYDYTDEHGELLYQVCRFHPKDFRQRRPDQRGGWIWNMEGVVRVLYRLPEVIRASTVCHCEGEKDADSLAELGYCASTSVGGAKAWLDAYAGIYAGKNVIIFPDQDPDGKAYGKAVLESIDGKALSAKLVNVPSPHKDVSDFIHAFPRKEEAKQAMDDLIDKTPHALKPLPLLSIEEMEQAYVEMLTASESRCLDLGKFLPSLGRQTRKLLAGELMAIIAGTGVGKTALLQAIARAAAPLPTVFFELELPAGLMFERFVQMEAPGGIYGQDVEQEYRTNPQPLWSHYKGLAHILTCPESGLSIGQIEEIIVRSELKSGRKPALAIVDYVGLVSPGIGQRSRYEAVSYAAEQLKVIAKRTNTIIIFGSQISRPSKESATIEVHLHDAKDSGSIENSAGLVIGCWRPDKDTLMLKILKNSKGYSGHQIACDFDGGRMQIKERATA